MNPATDTPLDGELLAITQQAEAIDMEQAAAVNPVDPNAAPPVPVDHTQDAREIIDFAHASLVPLYPSLEKIYTEDVRQRIAVAGGRLLAKYGVSLSDLFGRYFEEIGFAMVVLPLVVPTVKAIRADRAKADAPTAPPDPAAPIPEPDHTGPNPLGRFNQ